ncbi:c-type cytochrome [Piscinibacter sp.]|uniref:c-type cytochrome n=1 Tax=Piscinibacter sp. TaxID=1903157 RepID=UPI003559CBEF
MKTVSRADMLSALCLMLASPAHAAGDAANGQALYEARCTGCHSVDENRVGPAHRGVFGRKAGTRDGFGYSNALKASAIVWNESTLNAWLTEPERLIPGQVMNVQVSDAKARADIVAFLRSLKAR